MKKYTVILVSVLLFACAQEPTESIKWNDSVMESAFEQELLTNKIEFKKEYSQYWYSVSDRDAVIKIQQKIIATYAPGNAFWFKNLDMFEKVKNEFDSEGVKYKVLNSDYGPGLSWDQSEKIKARGIIRSVTNIPL